MNLEILLVEDNEIDQWAFRRFVEKEKLPYQVTMVATLETARDALNTKRFDIILADYFLRGATAFELLDIIQDIPSILITGLGDEEIAAKALKEGFSDYVVKDIESRYLTTLPLIISQAIDQKNARDQLQLYQERLEIMVEERTQELRKTNLRLEAEIAERQQAEDQIRLQARALESAANGILITDPQGIILWTNPAFTKLTGYTLEDVRGKTPSILKSGKSEVAHYKTLWDTILSGQTWYGTFINRRKNGEFYTEESTITPVLDADGNISHFIEIKQDISDRMAAQQRLQYLTTHDLLTHLRNRAWFHDRLDLALNQSKLHNTQGAVLFLDLDGFKAINDEFSHQEGDEVIKTIAQRLANCIGGNDAIARIGGDEFAVLVEEISHPEDAALIAEKLSACVNERIQVGHNDVFLTTSIGICIYPNDGKTVGALLQNADTAMYRAKEQGRNLYQYYTAEMTDRILKQINLANSLRHAFEENQFTIHYQPQVDIATGKITGVEALIRLQHPELGLIPPDEFIPLAEKTGQIIPIGEWVLRTACQDTKRWIDIGLGSLRIGVNLSSHQLKQSNLVEVVQGILTETGLPPHLLELELTESSVFPEADETLIVLRALKALGIKLAIDDFGTGYSSLGYLARFPLDTLKIDSFFTHNIPHDPTESAIVRGMIGIANSLSLDIIVEGVETQNQVDFFHRLGCDQIQGWYFSRPLTKQNLENLLQTGI